MSGTFDALGATRRLRDAGMDQAHCEAVTDIVRDSRNRLATEKGLDALRRELTTHHWILGLIASMSMATLVGIVVIAL